MGRKLAGQIQSPRLQRRSDHCPRSGKFHWDKSNAVNTPDGGTLLNKSKVTIDGRFVSKKEVKGTYRLHKAGCETVKFDAKLSK